MFVLHDVTRIIFPCSVLAVMGVLLCFIIKDLFNCSLSSLVEKLLKLFVMQFYSGWRHNYARATHNPGRGFHILQDSDFSSSKPWRNYFWVFWNVQKWNKNFCIFSWFCHEYGDNRTPVTSSVWTMETTWQLKMCKRDWCPNAS